MRQGPFDGRQDACLARRRVIRHAVKFGVLGPFLIYPGEPHQVRAAKHRTLLAILTVNANRYVSAGRLTEELWDGAPPSSAANLLRQYVSHLRRKLPGSGSSDSIKTMAGGYLLALQGRVVKAPTRLSTRANRA